MESTAPRRKFGDRLKQYRVDRKQSQAEVAKNIGISQSMLSQVENGDRELPLPAFEKLVSFWNVEPVALIGGGTPSQMVETLKKAWDAYDGARASFLGLSAVALEVVDFLKKHGSKVQSLLSQYGEVVWVEGVQAQLLKAADPKLLPDKTKHPKFDRFEANMISDKQRYNQLISHLENCQELSECDFAFVAALAQFLLTKSRPRQ